MASSEMAQCHVFFNCKVAVPIDLDQDGLLNEILHSLVWPRHNIDRLGLDELSPPSEMQITYLGVQIIQFHAPINRAELALLSGRVYQHTVS